MTDGVTEKALNEVFSSILSNAQDELQSMRQQDLERLWFFKHEPERGVAWNLYQFNSMLDLYRRKCRQWEEMHHGCTSVVERVRDRYLMPKIREFAETIRATEPDHIRLPTNRWEAEMILVSESYLRDLDASESKRA